MFRTLLYLIICYNSLVFGVLDQEWTGVIQSTGVSFAAKIPTGVYSDLEDSDYISPNFKGFNDVKNRWIGNETVMYFTKFQVNTKLLSANHVILILNGIDTFSTIYVNDIKVGSTFNMFLKYTFDIKDCLKKGENKLAVIFESSVKIAERLFTEQNSKYVVPPICVPKEYNGVCHVNHIRKMQASYGWDWGPAFPSIGIWKAIEIQSIDGVFVDAMTADVYLENQSWKVAITVLMKNFLKDIADNITRSISVTVTSHTEKQSIAQQKIFTVVAKDEYNVTIILDIPYEDVLLWWPNGNGDQTLYPILVRVESGKDVTEKELNIGYRTIELIQEPLQKGLSFYFKVNGVPIFAKGSNWIPSSVFPEKLSDPRTVGQLLESTQAANMNMLRVWGGGVYESDLFYDLADKLGIMIWQDFMFACSMYPTNDTFLALVEQEVRENTIRLKHHPSIVLWAGNNENEAALYGNWYGTGSNPIYREDYVKLYVDVIKNIVGELDKFRPFVVSSPSNGVLSEKDGPNGSNPYSNFYGDVHYYNYLKNGWDVNQYPITRFASEYGFQSLPSIWTFLPSIEKISDLEINSTFMKHRQHLPGGHGFMKLLIEKNFEIPKTKSFLTDSYYYIYLSQVNQAVSMKVQTESYRQMKSSVNDLFEGMTMGALYWQLNDVWQAPSWSSIEFSGRWKMLHYFAKDFFAPVIITSKLSTARDLYVYVVSDNAKKKLEYVTAKIITYKWNCIAPIHELIVDDIVVGINEAKLVKKFWLDQHLKDVGCGKTSESLKECFVALVLEDRYSKQIAPVNYVYPTLLKNVSLPKNSFQVQVESENKSSPKNTSKYLELKVNITSENPAYFVWLDLKKITGRFSENGFHILQKHKVVTLYSCDNVTVDDVKNDLIITSLSQIYDSSHHAVTLEALSSHLSRYGKYSRI